MPALLDQADLLLLFAQGQPTQVLHKLYEYLGASRPILAWADDAGETAEMLRAAGGHHIVTERTSDATPEIVAAALRAGGGVWSSRLVVLEDWRTDRQLARAIRLIERTHDSHHRRGLAG